MNAPTHRWNPFEELATLHRGLDRVFNRQQLDAGTPGVDGAGAWTPPCEVASTDDGWQVRLALPGVDPSRVQITLHGGSLRISGERPRSHDGDRYTHSEMSYGPFERTFTLPVAAAGDRIEAQYRHGILSVAVPVAERAKPRRIQIAAPDVTSIETKKIA